MGLPQIYKDFTGERKSSIIVSVCTFVFLFSLFFQRIFVGEPRHNYYVQFHYSTYAHIFEAVVILLAFFFLKKNALFFFKLKIIIRIVVFFAGVQLFYHYCYHLHPILGITKTYDIKSIRLGSYLISVLIFTIFFFDATRVATGFRKFCQFTIYFSVFSLLLYYIVGSGFQLNLAHVYPRLQGFTSEPSGLAPILAYYLVSSIKNRHKLEIFLTVLCIIFAKSPIVYITCSIILFSFVWSKVNLRYKTALIVFILLCVRSLFFLNQDLVKPYLKSNNSVVVAFARLAGGVTFIASNGVDGQNERYRYALETISVLKTHHLLWTGYGLNSASAYFSSIRPVTDGKDSTIFLSVLFFYGIIGCLIFGLLLLNAIHYFSLYDRTFFGIFASYLIASSINAAGGFISYKVLIVGLTIPLLKNFIFNSKLIKP